MVTIGLYDPRMLPRHPAESGGSAGRQVVIRLRNTLAYCHRRAVCMTEQRFKNGESQASAFSCSSINIACYRNSQVGPIREDAPTATTRLYALFMCLCCGRGCRRRIICRNEQRFICHYVSCLQAASLALAWSVSDELSYFAAIFRTAPCCAKTVLMVFYR